MSRKIWLDPHALGEPPEYAQVIQTELDFLKLAEADGLIYVRGKLCSAAEIYYSARHVTCEYIQTYEGRLQSLFPTLSGDEARHILRTYRDQLSDIETIHNRSGFWKALFPQPFWHQPPSIEHFARYLLWLRQTDILPALQELLLGQCQEWDEYDVSGLPCKYAAALSSEAANDILLIWLGVTHSENATRLAKFPEEVPAEMQSQARSVWKRRLIQTKGALFDVLRRLNLPQVMITIVAEEAASYFLANSQQLTLVRLKQLESLVQNTSLLEQLRSKIPVPEPGEVPTSLTETIRWYQEEYVPYRLFALIQEGTKTQEVLEACQRQFCIWLLETMPKLLVENPESSVLLFNRMRHFSAKTKKLTTLVIVLDGLALTDGETIKKLILNQVPELHPRKLTLGLSLLPTITQVCKPAIYYATLPKNVEESLPYPIKIVKENRSPLKVLKEAEEGEVIIWSHSQPDATYHKSADKEIIETSINAEFQIIVSTLKQILEDKKVSSNLRVVFTADHGRLPVKSKRKHPTPTGMESHGRAAIGKSGKDFPSSGYLIEGNIVYLSQYRYGLPYDAAFILNDEAFTMSGGKGGMDEFSHGGAFPEEVFVPWLEFETTVEEPSLEYKVDGRGQAGRKGYINFELTNPSNELFHVESIRVEFVSHGEVCILNSESAVIDPMTSQKIAIDFERYPTESEVATLKITLTLKNKDGSTNDIPVVFLLEDIHIEKFYTRDENPLEGLDL